LLVGHHQLLHQPLLLLLLLTHPAPSAVCCQVAVAAGAWMYEQLCLGCCCCHLHHQQPAAADLDPCGSEGLELLVLLWQHLLVLWLLLCLRLLQEPPHTHLLPQLLDVWSYVLLHLDCCY
jgi:hypothetical protein